MERSNISISRLLFHHHALISLLLVAAVTLVLSHRVIDRSSFADSDVKDAVKDRWGVPISQPAPTVKFRNVDAESPDLRQLAFKSQTLTVDASTNYRRRGLVFFSGFEFDVNGTFEVINPEPVDVEMTFVFPIQMRPNRMLLSDLTYSVSVDGKPAPEKFSDEHDDKLVWKGNAEPGGRLIFKIAYKGRGLDSFVWIPDPSLRITNLDMTLNLRGGSNFDYPADAIPASFVQTVDDGVKLSWSFASLESGAPMGAIVPSIQSWDQVISRTSSRAWAYFSFLFAGTLLLFAAHGRELRFVEAGLISASYAVVFPLLAYFAAVIPFWGAAALAIGIGGGLLMMLTWLYVSGKAVPFMAGLVVITLVVPTVAVVFESYTGLIYTLEATVALAAAIAVFSRPSFRALLERATVGKEPPPPLPQPERTRNRGKVKDDSSADPMAPVP